ncbi:MAG: DUF3375 domain-containing protein [Opitutaceae bacterium]|nr:DUF3375 domain-containing protein [Opitutaceae bacterium]
MFSPSTSASPLESLAALRDHFRNTPALVLLGATNAPYILHFFHLAFRKHAQISIPGSTLRILLQNYLDERRAEEPGSEWSAPEIYLREWTNSRYLHSYYPDDGDDPHYQLTAETQRVLGWIDALRQRSLIVTESRLQFIFGTLEEIIDHATATPETRSAQLRRQRDQIVAELARLEAGGEIEPYPRARLNERFELVRQQASQLIEDFAAVEEKFKELVRDIQQRHAESRGERGVVLGRALDAETELWQTDHGQSFEAFCHLLSDEERQQRFHEFVETVYALEAIDPGLRADGFLRRLRPNLTRATEKVLTTNRRLARQLRRVLAEDFAKQSLLTLTISDLRHLAASLRGRDPTSLPGLIVEADMEVNGVAERRPWDRAPVAAFPQYLENAGDDWDVEALANFLELESFDLDPLRERVNRELEGASMLTLSEMLIRHPLTHGMTELLGYYLVASGHQQAGPTPHHIERTVCTTVSLPGGRTFRCPEILFGRP